MGSVFSTYFFKIDCKSSLSSVFLVLVLFQQNPCDVELCPVTRYFTITDLSPCGSFISFIQNQFPLPFHPKIPHKSTPSFPFLSPIFPDSPQTNLLPRLTNLRISPEALIKIIKKQQSMNSKFTKNSFFNLPSIDQFPDINQSLKMINTVNAFPIHSSLENIQLPLERTPPQQEEDSLGERISFVPTSTNSSRKKKIGCTCKKTLCLKMYCECFSTGKECGQDCACIGCKNTAEFKEEIIQAKIGVKEGGLRSCSLAEKRCNCKKSGCLKRYCECFNSGVGCSDACKCQGCKNIEKPAASESPIEQPEEVKQEIKIQNVSQFPSLKKCNSLDDFSKYYD